MSAIDEKRGLKSSLPPQIPNQNSIFFRPARNHSKWGPSLDFPAVSHNHQHLELGSEWNRSNGMVESTHQAPVTNLAIGPHILL